MTDQDAESLFGTMPAAEISAKDAFAIAFDAVPPPPGMPKLNKKAKAYKQRGAAALSPSKMRNVAAAPGAKSSSDSGTKSLAEHMETCEAQSAETCPYLRKHKAEYAKSHGISEDEALQQMWNAHVSFRQQKARRLQQQDPMTASQKVLPQGQPLEGGTAPQPEAAPQPEVLEGKAAAEKVAELVKDPASIPDAPEVPIKPEKIDGMEAKTAAAAAGATVLAEAAADGDETAGIIIEQVKQELASSGEPEKEPVPEKAEAEKPAETTEESEAPKEEILSDEENTKETEEPKEDKSTESTPIELKEGYEAGDILPNGRKLKEGFSTKLTKDKDGNLSRIDFSDRDGKWIGTELKSGGRQTEYGRLDAEQIAPWEEGETNESAEEPKPEAEKAAANADSKTKKEYKGGDTLPDGHKLKEGFTAAPDETFPDVGLNIYDSKGNKVGEYVHSSGERFVGPNVLADDKDAPWEEPSPKTERQPSEEEPRAEGGAEEETKVAPEDAEDVPSPDEGGNDQPIEENEEPPLRSRRPRRENPALADERFRTGAHTYRVGGRTYRDVSNMGILRGLIHSAIAGLRGEQLITGWDRISGTWDTIKRSAAGELVRDGIFGARMEDEFDKAMEDKRIADNTEAQAILARIRNAYLMAKSPNQELAAIRNFQKWKRDYGLAPKKPSKATPVKNDETKFSPSLTEGMDSIHKDGGCLTTGTSIDSAGKITKSAPSKIKNVPTASHLGAPQWAKKAEFKDIGNVAKSISDFIKGELGIDTSDVFHKTSFNQSQISMKVGSSEQGKEVIKQLDNIIGEVGHHMTASYDAPSRTVTFSIDNPVQGDVTAKEIFASDAWENAKKSMSCPVVIGKDMDGNPVIADLKKLKHVLIGGETGNGKSVAMNTILTSIMMGQSPDDTKLILIDPKSGVEFGAYANSKHNLLPVAKTPTDSISHLRWLKDEMENRLAYLDRVNQENGLNLKDIESYNDWAKANGKQTMPRLVCAIDELTDLRENSPKELDNLLQTLGNKARAASINVLAATQNPTKRNIGAIKDNLPARIGFKTTNREAPEAILGHGDRTNPKTGKTELGTNSLGRAGEFVFEYGGQQIHGQGANTGEEDAARISAYWNGKDVPLMPPAKEETPSAPEPTPNPSSKPTTTSEAPTATETKGGTASSTAGTKGKSESSGKTTAEGKSSSGTKVDLSSRKGILGHAKKMHDQKLAEAKEAFSSHGDIKKFNKALDDIEAEDKQWEDLADRLFPEEQYENGDETEKQVTVESKSTKTSEKSSGEGGKGKKEEAKSSEPEEKEEQQVDEFARRRSKEFRLGRAAAKRDAALKALDKESDLSESEYEAKLKEIEKVYRQAEKDIAEGLTPEQIEARNQKAADEEDRKFKAIRDKIPLMSKGKPIPGATHIAESTRGSGKVVKMPKALATTAERFLEKNYPGFEIDSDDNGNPLWLEGRYGFARNPKTGVYGKVKADGTFRPMIDPTNPYYKGVDSPAAKKAYKRALANNISDAEFKKRLQDYNLIAYGVPVRDKAPSNTAIVAAAVVEALRKPTGTPTEG